MNRHLLLQRCREYAGTHAGPHSEAIYASPWSEEDAIGFLQSLRPHGQGLAELFDGVPHGDELVRRLRQVFAAAGDGRRPGGGRDAYFIVRAPDPIEPQRVADLGRRWLDAVAELDRRMGPGQLADLLRPEGGGRGPQLRVLEGLPPKHPRAAAERCRLLTALLAFPAAAVEPLEPPDDAALGLARGYYFMACDRFLRDYLLWPVYRGLVDLVDPLEPYFVLWQHGVKYRIFNDQTVDLYIPRRLICHTGLRIGT